MRKQLLFGIGAAGIFSLLAGMATIRSLAQAQNKPAPVNNPFQSQGVAPVVEVTERYLPDTPANRQLHQAILRGDLRKVKAALDAGASPDSYFTAQPGKTPDYPILFVAAYKLDDERPTYLPIFRLLTKQVHDVNIELPSNHTTLLMAAVEMGDLEIVKSLVQRGAKIDTQTAVDPNGFGHGPTGGESVFYTAINATGIRGPDPDPIVCYLLEKGADINSVCGDGSTSLMRAAEFNKLNTVRLLLKKGADPTKRDLHGLTALQWAVMRGNDEIVALLTPLTKMDVWEAAQQGKAARVKELLASGADPNAFRVVEYQNRTTNKTFKEPVGETPLMAAAQSDDVTTVQALLKAGADARAIQPRTGVTALDVAARYGSNAVIPLLLKAGADINAQAIRHDENGKPEADRLARTPLIAAATAAQADTVALLLKSGIDMAAHNQGDLALMWNLRNAGQEPRRPRNQSSRKAIRGEAVLSAQDKILDLLLNAGAHPDQIGGVAIAAEMGQPGIVQYLLAKGASPNATYGSGPDGKTALIAAIEGIGGAKWEKGALHDGTLSGPTQSDINNEGKGYRDCLTILLKAKAGVNVANSTTGETPFMAAIEEGEYQIAEELLKRGAKREAVDNYGHTALLRAVTGNDLAGVKWLLQRKADLTRRDKDGLTALMLAIDAGENAQWEQVNRLTGGSNPERPNPDGHPAMVALLLAHGADKTAVAGDGKTTALTLAITNKFTKVEKMLSAR